MAKRSPQRRSPTRLQAQPSAPASPPRLTSVQSRLLALASTLGERFLEICFWLVSWIWGRRWGLWSGLFRVATLLSVFYLVYDRFYETAITISISASDPHNPTGPFLSASSKQQPYFPGQ